MKKIICIKCGETRESEFYPSSLKKSDYRCKVCVSKSVREWQTKNREYGRNYIRNHLEDNRRNFHKWYDNHAAEHYQRRLAYARANPQRHRAQTYAFRELDTQVCEIEGCIKLGERHHDDYSKPLEIRWLCKKHHKELHRQLLPT